MELVKAFILGAVQGITEFLPISSTGHLILFEKLLGVSQETYGLAFDAALHIGTLAAVLWYFRDEWIMLVKCSFVVILNLIQNPKNIFAIDSRFRGNDKLVLLLFIGTIPAALIGLKFEKVIDSAFRAPLLVATALILFSFAFLYVEKQGKKTKTIVGLNQKDSFFIGLAQAIALIPGVSRSGITMVTGMFKGLTREQAAKFAFLLSAPIVAGAGGKKLIDTFQLYSNGQLGTSELIFFAVGMISALVFGYLTIKYFLKFIATNSLLPFIYYRLLIGILIILFFR